MKSVAAVCVGSVLAACSAAQGQAFNIDFGNPGQAPASTYAAAGLPGFWNALTMLPNGSVLPLNGLDGQPGPVVIRNIGGTQLLVNDDPATSGDDAALLDDMLIGFNNPVDLCIFIDNLEPGDYEVLIYALTPSNAALISPTRVDFANEPETFVGGAWTGSHSAGVSYSRFTVTVTTGRIGLHSGTPSGFFQSGINGIQIRPLVPPPACKADANGDNRTDAADLSVLLAQFGQSVPPGTDADFNGDGEVNAADLSVLLAQFGCGQ